MSEPHQKSPPPPPPEMQLMQMMMGKFVSRGLTLVAELGVADHLKSGPVPVTKLAADTGANEDALYRLLRALAAVGVFIEHDGRAFGLTPISEVLRSDTRPSLRAMARMLNMDPSWAAWGRLDHSVSTGKPAFDKVHGMQIFEYFKTHPSESALFDAAMGSFTAGIAQAVAKAYDFSDVKHLVDVGGSHGVLLACVLDRFPNLRATLFELPHVLEGAKKALGPSPHKARIEPVAGDFFESVPQGADAYIMKSIIHDWDDEHCKQLLANCRTAMQPGGRVLIVEGVVSAAPESTPVKLLDLEMLVMTTGGRERTEAEFSALLSSAGLKLARIVRTESPLSVIEAFTA